MSSDPLPSRLREFEIDALVLTFTEAVDCAEAGMVLDGYRCLLGAPERAQVAYEDIEPWGPERVYRHRLALERYGEQWGIQLE